MIEKRKKDPIYSVVNWRSHTTQSPSKKKEKWEHHADTCTKPPQTSAGQKTKPCSVVGGGEEDPQRPCVEEAEQGHRQTAQHERVARKPKNRDNTRRHTEFEVVFLQSASFPPSTVQLSATKKPTASLHPGCILHNPSASVSKKPLVYQEMNQETTWRLFSILALEMKTCPAWDYRSTTPCNSQCIAAPSSFFQVSPSKPPGCSPLSPLSLVCRHVSAIISYNSLFTLVFLISFILQCFLMLSSW